VVVEVEEAETEKPEESAERAAGRFLSLIPVDCPSSLSDLSSRKKTRRTCRHHRIQTVELCQQQQSALTECCRYVRLTWMQRRRRTLLSACPYTPRSWGPRLDTCGC
jgi:hypothetical protein